MKNCLFCGEPHNSRTDYCCVQHKHKDANNRLQPKYLDGVELFNAKAFEREMPHQGSTSRAVYYQPAKFHLSKMR